MRDLVSVVIPFHNPGPFLRESIQSVLNQNYSPVEIIAVDDGSTTSVKTVCDSFAEVTYLWQPHQGPGPARNSGFAKSSGKYVVFLDADDRLLPNALQIGISSLQKQSELAFVSGHVVLMDEAGTTIDTPEVVCIQKNHYQALLLYNYIWTTGVVMFRSQAFKDSSGFERSFFTAEDWDLYLRIARTQPVLCHDKVVVEHRMHKAKLSCRSAILLRDSLKVLQGQTKHVCGNQQYETALKAGIKTSQEYWSRPLVHEIREQFAGGSWTDAIRNVWYLFRYNPAGFASSFLPFGGDIWDDHKTRNSVSRSSAAVNLDDESR